MRSYMKWLCYSFIVGAIAACSPVRFSNDEMKVCENNQGCIVDENGMVQYGPFIFKIGSGKADILFVNDNSASMSFEQSKMAQRFANFVQNLDTQKVDYRIAMTTTDIESSRNPRRLINKDGALQNGELITFQDNSRYLTPQSANRVNLFNLAITRPETLQCENFIRNYLSQYGPNSRDTVDYNNKYFDNCPSTDERGVYAANLTVMNNYHSFVRPDANLTVILLSDEDARSEQYAMGNPDYLLESLDQPATFASMMQSKYPGKMWNFHTFIVRDQQCKTQQRNQILDSLGRPVVEGSYGNLYSQFNLTLRDDANRPRGLMLDICSNDYTTPLGQISTNISDRLQDLVLKCSDPISLSILPASVMWTKTGSVIKFTQPAPGTEVSVSYKCRPAKSL